MCYGKVIMLNDMGECYSCEYEDKDDHEEPCIDCPNRLREEDSKWSRKKEVIK